MRKSCLGFILAVLFLIVPKIHADGLPDGFMIQPDIIYYFTTEGGAPPYQQNVNVTREVGDVIFGYHFNNIFLGVNYDYDSIITSQVNTSTDTFQSWGANLGMMTDNLYLFFTYYFNSAAKTQAGTTNEVDFSNGNGYQIALGYIFELGSGWGLGPSLIYKSITYNQSNTGPTANFTYTTLVPVVSIRYNF